MDELYLRYQKDYLSATQALKQSLNGRPSTTSPETLLEEVKLVVRAIYLSRSSFLPVSLYSV